MSLVARLKIRVAAAPDAPALVDARSDGGETWSAATLWDRAGGAAAWLAEQGIGPGDRVLLLLPSSPTFVALVWGAWRLGAVAVPVEPSSSPRERRFFAEHAGAKLVIEVAPALPATGRVSDTDADPRALLLYTSGSTGDPKGVVLSHVNVLASIDDTIAWFGFDTATRLLCVLNLTHGHGLIVALLAPLIAGGTVVLEERFHAFSAGRFWPVAREHDVTCFSSVPSILRTLLRLTGPEDRAPTVQFGLCASAALSETFQREFEETFGLVLANNYGLTETATWVTRSGLSGDSRRPGTVGRPTGCQVRIAEGAVQVRGPQVSPGYHDNPDATARAFHDGWLDTGDLGRLDADGFLHLAGRAKEVISRGADKIYPAELEEVLLAHPAVAVAAAVAGPSKHYGEEPVAFVVLQGDATPAELRAWCRERLTSFKVPRTVHVETELPRGRTGKLDKRALQARLAGGS
jgi:acyl-CoA synthetase (AMP-forming)/AMP-acid ligase II